MIKCWHCKIEKTDDDFAFKKKEMGIRSSHCRACQKILRKKYYDRNKKKVYAQVSAKRREKYTWFRDYKKNLFCNRCGFSNSFALQFHHSDPTKKEFTLCHALQRGISKSSILAELEKCEVLCANCHSIHHAEERVELRKKRYGDDFIN